MPRLMKSATAFSIITAVISSALFHRYDVDICLTLAVTFGTTAYHLGIRLLVGLLFNLTMKNRADCTKKWYQIRPWENRLYRLLKVKKWKDKMPTYDPELFSVQKHTWNEIAQAMCQSELVHETNILLSFIPLVASCRFGSFFVFFITSACGAIFDLLFVIMQRYNRPRVMRMARKQGNLLH